MISTRRPIFTRNASSLSMAQTTKPVTFSQPQPSDSTNLTQPSTSSPVPVTISVQAAMKLPPNAALHLVDTQKRVVCSNTRLYYLLPLRSVRLSSFQSFLFASLTRRYHPTPSPNLQSSTEPRTTRVASTVQDAASLHCHSGILAAKACLTSEAIASFTRALQLEPLLWEAWTGLCALGAST